MHFHNYNFFGKIVYSLMLLLFITAGLTGCGKKDTANPAVENLAYQYFNAKSRLIHGKINAAQFEQEVNSINLNGVPNNIQDAFIQLKAPLFKFVNLNFKSAGDILFEIGSSAVRGFLGDTTVLVDAGKQIMDSFKGDEYLNALNRQEAYFINSLSSAGISKEWLIKMFKKVGL